MPYLALDFVLFKQIEAQNTRISELSSANVSYRSQLEEADSNRACTLCQENSVIMSSLRGKLDSAVKWEATARQMTEENAKLKEERDNVLLLREENRR